MSEPILSLGIEGGGAVIHRTPLPFGGHQFHVEGNSLSLDEDDNEYWRHWTTEPVETIQDALNSIDKDGRWILFHPMSVHPEYRIALWQWVQELALALPEDHARMWQARSQEWQRHCLNSIA